MNIHRVKPAGKFSGSGAYNDFEAGLTADGRYSGEARVLSPGAEGARLFPRESNLSGKRTEKGGSKLCTGFVFWGCTFSAQPHSAFKGDNAYVY